MPISKAILESARHSSWIRRMFEKGAELKRTYGVDQVFDLTLGNPVLEPPERFYDALADLANRRHEGLHRYMPNAGFPAVREAIAKKLSDDGVFPGVTASGVIMSVGAGGGLNATLKAILDAGDEVVFLSPYFVEYIFYVRNHGGEPVIAETDERFDIDLDALAAAITPRTKAVILNSPNNPTGRMYPLESLEAMGKMLADKEREFGKPIYLLADDPYREIVYPDAPPPTPAVFHPNSFFIYSWSKNLSIPGDRIGFVAINPASDCPKALSDAITFTTRTLGFVNAPAILQLVVAEVLDLTVDVEWYRARRDRLLSGLRDAGYDIVTPEGTFYMFPRSPDTDDVAFANRAMNERVLVVPGSGFGRAGHFRLCYAVDDRTLEGGLEGLARLMRS